MIGAVALRNLITCFQPQVCIVIPVVRFSCIGTVKMICFKPVTDPEGGVDGTDNSGTAMRFGNLFCFLKQQKDCFLICFAFKKTEITIRIIRIDRENGAAQDGILFIDNKQRKDRKIMAQHMCSGKNFPLFFRLLHEFPAAVETGRQCKKFPDQVFFL